MTTSITIYDETLPGERTASRRLDLLSSTITLRELIRRRVYEEVQDYPAAPPSAVFRALVTVGWVHVFGVFLLASPQFFAEIGGLVVDAAARRQGIGGALVRQAETWAGEHGFAEVRLRSGLHRTGAHEFYRSIGYELAKTSHLFRKALGLV